MYSALILAVSIAGCFAAEGSDWNYVRSDQTQGPDAWKTNFAQCGLDKNSPIDIKPTDTTGKKREKWTLSGWETKTKWNVQDTEFAIKLTLEAEKSITTTGGGLLTAYNLVQFHFHWGTTNNVGSEHTVNGQFYPLEVHFVHMRSDFKDLTAAVTSGESDALAVLGFFFKIQNDDNAELAELMEAVDRVRNSNTSETGYTMNALTDFASAAVSGSYYRYDGGLTTPGCQQIVKWTVFETPIGISEAQMEKFRNHKQTKYGDEFYRPVQKIGTREVLKYDADYSAANSITPLTALLIAGFLAKLI